MNVLYMTWGETPRSYGVFNSQVIKQFLKTKNKLPDAKFSFISAVPIFHSGLLREKLGYKDEIKKIKEEFTLDNIDFTWVPMVIPQNLIYTTNFIFNYVQCTTQLLVNYKVDLASYDIVHCRSYFAAYAANKLREKYNYRYKVVFDARGFLPEEIALKEKLHEKSKKYSFLKVLESYLLEHSDVTITVSDTMYESFYDKHSKKLENIYLSTDFEKLVSKNKKRKAIELDTQINILYLGALGVNSWHQPNVLLKVFKKIKLLYKNAILTIITTDDHEKLKTFFTELDERDLKFLSIKNHDELANELNKVDLGVLPYRENGSFAEEIVGKSILGTKTVEYLASGIPVLCNEDCGGAAALIMKNPKFGIVEKKKKMSELSEASLHDLLNSHLEQHDFDMLYNYFDYSSNAKKYADIYESLML